MDGTSETSDLFNALSINSDNFDAAEYVSQIITNMKTGDETKQMNQLKQILATKSNTTSEAIKNIVFDHYKHFIEASRSVYGLESGIYQLTKSINEQRVTIASLMEMCGQDKASQDTSSATGIAGFQQKELHFLMYKIDGIAAILNNLKENERIVLHNQMTLLNPDSFENIHPVYLVLLTNSILISYPNPTNSKYQFSLVSNQHLNDIAIINVKNSSRTNMNQNAGHVFQLLIFPEQIFVKCESARTKRDWLDTIEELKRKQQELGALVRQATIKARRQSILASFVSKTGFKKPGEISEIEDETADKQSKPEDTQWLKDLIVELQDIISHRHMDQAIEMLLEWKSCNCTDTTINSQFEALEQSVIQLLSEEIKRPGPVTKRLSMPMQQLIALNRGFYAVDLYLRRQSSVLREGIKELHVSEEPLFYVRQVSTMIVNTILEMCKEFSEQIDYYPLILQWSFRELNVLISLVRRHVLEAAPTMTVLAHTWRILTGKCALLAASGIDLSFEVNRLATPSLQAALDNNFRNIIESHRLRIADDGRPFNLENEQNMNRFLEEMSDLRLSLDWAISRNPSRKWCLNVSQNSCHFARTVVSLSRDLAVITTSHLQSYLDDFIVKIWSEYLEHLNNSLKISDVQSNNCKFIVSQVVPLCDRNYGKDNLIAHLILKFPDLAQYLPRSSESGTSDEHFDDGEVAAV